MLATRLKGASSAGGLIYVGGQATVVAGSGIATVSFNLSGGIATVPATGDLIIIGYAVSSTSDINVSILTAGYTEIYDLYANDAYDANLGVYYKIAGSTDGTFDVDSVGSTSNARAVYVSVWRNENSTFPFRSVSSATATDSILANPPSIAATGSVNAVVAMGAGALNTINANYSSSDLTNFQSTRQAATNSIVIGGGYKNPVTGTFDPAAFTGPTSSSSASWAAASLEVREQNQNIPSFVSLSNTIGDQNDTSVTVVAPSGIQNGDLLIAVGYLSNTNETITLPTGFTSVYSQLTSSPEIRVGYKIASNESGNYTFTYGIDSDTNSTILVYRNCSYNVVGTINRLTSTATATANALTSPNVGINLYMFTSSAANATVSTGVTGATQRLMSNTSGFNVSLTIYEEIATVPISANKSITWSSSSGNTTGIQLNITG